MIKPLGVASESDVSLRQGKREGSALLPEGEVFPKEIDVLIHVSYIEVQRSYTNSKNIHSFCASLIDIFRTNFMHATLIFTLLSLLCTKF